MPSTPRRQTLYPSFFSRDLFSEMDRLQRDMRHAVDTMSPSIRGFAQGFPALNVGSAPTSVEIFAFAPGIDPKKVQIDLDRRVLSIAGERAPLAEGPDAQATAHISERFAGRFRRVVSLPDDIDPNAIDATYRDGVLRIGIERRESAQPRRIAVQ